MVGRGVEGNLNVTSPEVVKACVLSENADSPGLAILSRAAKDSEVPNSLQPLPFQNSHFNTAAFAFTGGTGDWPPVAGFVIWIFSVTMASVAENTGLDK